MDSWGASDARRVPSYYFTGARKINYDTALKATVTHQNFSICPRFWYIDAIFECSGCRKDFTFSATEQRYWYEDLYFWVDSSPNHCPACRKAQRTKANLKKRYDELINKALGKASPDEKKEALEIINQLELVKVKLTEKMKQNRNILLEHLAKL